MTAETFELPETVTVSGSVALETLALLEAFETICADFNADADARSAMDNLVGDVWGALANGFPDPSDGMDTPPVFDAAMARAAEIEPAIRRFMGESNDTFRIAMLERALLALGQEVIGVVWDGERKWLTPKRFVSAVTTSEGGEG